MGKFKMTSILRSMDFREMVVLPLEAYNSARVTRDHLQQKNLGKWAIQKKNGITIQRLNDTIPEKYVALIKNVMYEDSSIEIKMGDLLIITEGEIINDVEKTSHDNAPDEYETKSSVFKGLVTILDTKFECFNSILV